MTIFKNKYEKQLDDILKSLKMNMSNNYKDNAQSNLRELEAAFEEYKNSSKLNARAVARYEQLLTDLKNDMQGYSHKDQKPYWT